MYHSWVNRIQKLLSIDGMYFNSIMMDSVEEVKNGVHEFFRNRFWKKRGLRPRIPKEFFSKTMTMRS